MIVRRAGARALLIECPDSEQVEAWRAELWRRRESGALDVAEIVPGARTILLDGVDPTVASRLTQWAPTAKTPSGPGPLVEIPAVFDGEDLPRVAEIWAVPVAEVITRLVEASLVVAFCGFAPGFGYLRGLPEAWAVPRLPAPRPRVPAGAIGLAGAYAGIYPSASPGGWQLVGHTDQELFDVRRQPPALLAPGTRVRLVPA
jgi:KipI family sensor histidine kinase inhibitor